MALIHTNTTVSTTPIQICQLPVGSPYTAVQIFNGDNSIIYVGDSVVTTAAGANQGSQIASKASLQIWLHAGDALYAVAAGTTTAGAVSVIYSGR